MEATLTSQCLKWFILVVLSLELTAAQKNSDSDYWAQRLRIVTEEFSSSIGSKLEFSNGEEAANDILMAAKEKETSRGFRNSSAFLPARNFLTVIEDIHRSPTFQIIKKMPKGAVLHAHDTGLVSTNYIYENITFRENLYICRPADGSVDFKFLRSATTDANCTSSTGWELIADLRANDTIVNDVNTLIRNSLTLIGSNHATDYSNIDDVWVAFRRILRTVGQLVGYLPVYSDSCYQSLKELREDNVIYLEIRSSVSELYDLDGNIHGVIEAMRIWKNATDRFLSDYPDFVGAKLILSSSRRGPATMIEERLLTAVAVNREFPGFVAGYDLVGQEDKGEPLIQFVDKLRIISPDIRLFLHAGETNWNGFSTDENLIDAVLLNTTRIGHAYAILKHPKVLELVKQRDIAIEVNPISNQVLTHVRDLRNHPASFLFTQDYPVVVSSDDPGPWGAAGLSYDFYEAFIGIMSRHADIRALKQLAINSIKYSAMSDDEKNHAFAIWEKKWATFIADLVRDNQSPSSSGHE